MLIFINGQEVKFTEAETMSQAVKDFISDGTEIIICNGKYLPWEDCDKLRISDGDKIEIIRFLAGG